MINKLSVIIPVYNEEACIHETVQRISKGLDARGITYEIIAVDDASQDKSHQILLREKESREHMSILQHHSNKGYGASLVHGIRKAKYDYVAIVDADGTYPLEELPTLFAAVEEGYDMVVGSRTGAVALGSFSRRMAKGFLTALANYLTGTKIPDINSGMRVIKKEAVLRFANILPKNFSFTTTITLAMLSNDYEVKFIPITYGKRKGGKSKISPFKDTLNFTQLIIRTVMYFNPLKIFIPLGFLLFAFFLFFFIRDSLLVRLSIKTLLLFVAFLVTFTTGCLADLIDKRLMK